MISKWIAELEPKEVDEFKIHLLQEALIEVMGTLREAAEVIDCRQDRDLLRKMWKLIDKWEGE